MAGHRSLVVLAVALEWLAAGCAAEDRTVPLGAGIRHDDFVYTVRAVAPRTRIGAHPASGTFYVVDMAVENRARRVQHLWGNDIAFATDDRGRTFDNDGPAQAALAALEPFPLADRHTTPPGATDMTRLVFDIPRDAGAAYLRLRGEFLMGDLFDGSQFLHARVKIF